MDEPGNAAKTLDAPSAEDSIELLVQQPCADVLGRLAMIAEPFSYYVAWIPGERNRKVDFWIRGTGNRFEVWPKTRTTAWVTTSRKSGLLRACIRGEVVAQSEGCLLKARIDEGFLQDYTKLGSILAIAFLLFILLLALVGSMVTGTPMKALEAVAMVAAFSLLVLGMSRLASSENQRAIDNDMIHIRRFMQMLNTLLEDDNAADTEIVSHQAFDRTEVF